MESAIDKRIINSLDEKQVLIPGHFLYLRESKDATNVTVPKKLAQGVKEKAAYGRTDEKNKRDIA